MIHRHDFDQEYAIRMNVMLHIFDGSPCLVLGMSPDVLAFKVPVFASDFGF